MPRRDYSKVPFAATGDINIIPTATQPDGSISLQNGWGFDYQRDSGAGGGTPDPLAKNIDREDMNGVLNEITASIGEIQQNGYPSWAASAAPYPINSRVRHLDQSWLSGVSNNNSTPGSGGDWVVQPSVVGATEAYQGIIEIASASEAQGWSDNTRAITPKGLADSFKGSNQLNSQSNGWERLPSGRIRQNGQVTISAGGVVAVTLPITFPNSGISANACIATVAFEGNDPGLGVDFFNTSTIRIRNSYSGGALLVWWQAEGY